MNCPITALKKAIRKVNLPTQLPPRPKGHRFLGLLPGKRDWMRCFAGSLKEVGDVAYCKYVGIPACLVGHPDEIADVLVVNAQSYTKSNMLRMLLGRRPGNQRGRTVAAGAQLAAPGIQP